MFKDSELAVLRQLQDEQKAKTVAITQQLCRALENLARLKEDNLKLQLQLVTDMMIELRERAELKNPDVESISVEALTQTQDQILQGEGSFLANHLANHLSSQFPS